MRPTGNTCIIRCSNQEDINWLPGSTVQLTTTKTKSKSRRNILFKYLNKLKFKKDYRLKEKMETAETKLTKIKKNKNTYKNIKNII